MNYLSNISNAAAPGLNGMGHLARQAKGEKRNSENITPIPGVSGARLVKVMQKPSRPVPSPLGGGNCLCSGPRQKMGLEMKSHLAHTYLINFKKTYIYGGHNEKAS